MIASRPFAIPASAFVLNEGIGEINRGNAPRALELFLEITRAEPSHPAGWSWAGRAFLSLQQPRDAVTCFSRVLQLDPSFWPDLGLKGRALLTLGDAVDALPCFEQVLARDPTVMDAYADRARCLFLLRRWKECLESLTQLQARGQQLTAELEQLCRDAKTQIGTGAPPSAAMQEHLAAALQFIKAGELNEQTADAFDYDGDPATAQDRLQQAIDAYSRAAKEFELAGKVEEARRALERSRHAAEISYTYPFPLAQ